MAKQMVAGLALVVLMMAGLTVVSGQAPNPMYPPCGEYVGQEYYVSKSGYCTLPDGEIMQGGIWAPRNPGQSVTYVVPWQTGSDQSQGRGYGYAAIHGCTGDIVKFVFNGTDTHNLVEIASQPQAPCNFTNAKTWVDPVGPGAVYNLSSPVDAFRNFADSLGDNCMKGKMHIQVIMHRPTTPKYGCYKAGAKLPPGYTYYPNAPPPPPIVGSTGDGVTAAPAPSPSPSPPPPTKSPPPPPPPSPSPSPPPAKPPPPPPAKSPSPPPPAKSPSPPPPAKSPPPPPASPSPPPPSKTPVATTPSPSPPPPPPAVSTDRPPVTSQQKTYPPCGQYVGVEYYVSKSGYCMLPDGEIMQGGIWAPRNPGQSVTYVVPWQTGSDQSQGKGYGYAAIHGCTGDTIKFVFNGSDTHNLVEIASQPQAPCNFTNAKTWVDPVGPGAVFNLSSPVDAFRNFADSLGDNCMKGKMHIQLVMHRPTTPKYGCYAPGAKLPADFKYFPNAPPSVPATESTGNGVTATPIPSPSPPPPPPPSSPPPPPPAKSPPPPPAKSPPPPPPAAKPTSKPPPPPKSPSPPPPKKASPPPPPPSKTPAAKSSPPPPAYAERGPVGSEQDQCQCYC